MDTKPHISKEKETGMEQLNRRKTKPGNREISIAQAFVFLISAYSPMQSFFASFPSILLTNSKHIHQHLKEHGKFIKVLLVSQIPIFDD